MLYRRVPVALLLTLLLALTLACSGNTQQSGPSTDAPLDTNADTEEVDTWVPPPVATAVAVGQAHVCALMSDAVVKCWGSNGKGQLGRDLPPAGSDADAKPEPEATAELDPPLAILAGWSQTCALHAGGKASCWGANEKGQLGNGKDVLVYGVDKLAAELAPDVVQDTGGIKAFSIGHSHSCAVGNDKRVRCWGGNDKGQLGNNKPLDSRKPDFVKMASGYVSVAAGENHTCAVHSDGSVRCWGGGADGRLGNGSESDSPSPAKVSDLSDATAVVAGRAHTCALRDEGKVSCWGAGSKGQLGDGSGKSSSSPVEVKGLSGATALAAGSDHTCALVTGTMHCWGGNDSGQLSGSASAAQEPMTVKGLGSVVSFDAGGGTTCALTDDEQVRCWGDNAGGQLGMAAKGATSGTPIVVTFPGPVVVQPDAGPTDTSAPDIQVEEDAGQVDTSPPVDTETDGGSTPTGGVVFTASQETTTAVMATLMDGPAKTVLANAKVIAPAGGGRILVFIPTTKELSVSQPDGSLPIVVAGNVMEPTGHGALSADGQKVAFLKSPQTGSAQLALGWISSSGTEAGKLEDNAANGTAMAFSPDSTRLAWYGSAGTLRATMDGLKNGKQLNDKALAFGTPAVASSLGWSPLGKKLVFTIRHQVEGGPVSSDIAVVDADGSNLILLTNDAILDAELAVGKDGTVWFQRMINPETSSEIWRVGLNGQGLLKLSTQGGGLHRLPRPSPDNKRVLYLSSTGFAAGVLTEHDLNSTQTSVISQAAINGFWL